ncbi:MAG: DUF2807 domain-containing protein [Dehalococcoidales bacterium]|nr:DUF2807 domain-containing protein [Dehalococcoidales bacterium]
MKRVIIPTVLMLVMIISLTGCSGTIGSPVTGSGTIETRTLDYADFTRLEIDNAFEAEITRADSFALSITTNTNIFDYLDIRKSGSTLHIGLQRNHTYINTTQKAVITMPDLLSLVVSGASKTQITGFSSTSTTVFEVSGASRLELTDIKTGNCHIEVSGASRMSGNLTIADGNFNISGASTIELTGTAESITADISGASGGKLELLPMVNGNFRVSGASNATIAVSGRLDANVSGASRMYYSGNPTLRNISVTSASTFTKK